MVGSAWQGVGASVAGGMCGDGMHGRRGACVAGGGRGWQGWQGKGVTGACLAGGMRGGGVPGRREGYVEGG